MSEKRDRSSGSSPDGWTGDRRAPEERKVLPPRGRGAGGNPEPRFARLRFERDPNANEPEDDLDERTRFLRDSSRSVISRNNSPDIPFDVSLNPYRGCEHGCSYCLSGETPILLADGGHRNIEALRTGDQIYGTAGQGNDRRLVRTAVLDHWSSYRRAYRVTLSNGAELVASGDHRFLTERGWKHVKDTERGQQGRAHSSLQPILHSSQQLTLEDRLLGEGLTDSPRLRVTNIEDLGVSLPMFDITTGTGDFIANGVVSHNCYARPTHEYLGFSPGLDFERIIMVKEDAPKLLERELRRPSWKPTAMLLSGVTDPYQPVERRLGITRACLGVLRDFRHPVSVITKNHLVVRDIDILAELAAYDAAHVTLSITTLDEELRRRLEPRTSTGLRRLDAVRQLSGAGIPVSVNIAPVIPGLNDKEIPAILEAAAEAGARSAHFILVRLPGAVEPLFIEWLERHYPLRKEKVLGRLREARGGKLNESAFGKRMRGGGPYAESIRTMFHAGRRRHGLTERSFELNGTHFRVPGSSTQPGLFEAL